MTAQFEQISDLLKELDLLVNFKDKVPLYLVGGAAITLLYDKENRTADLDFIDPPDILISKGGEGSPLMRILKN